MKSTGNRAWKIALLMNLPYNKVKKCTLHDILLVPDLAYNLLSIPSASKRENETKFSEMTCEIRDCMSKIIATGHREGSLIMVGPSIKPVRALIRKDLRDCRFRHIGTQSLQELVKSKMTKGLDFDSKQELSFCVYRGRVTGYHFSSLRKGQITRWS